MKFITPTLLALALPAATEGYSIGRFYAPVRPSSSSACRPGTRCGPEGFGLITPEDMMAMRQRRRNAFKEAFQGYSPGYQIVDDEEKFQVQIDVPGVKAEDINVNLEEDGKLLTLSGSRERSKDGSTYSSKFSQSFSLDPTVDGEAFSAKLQNGVLIVSAPKDVKKIEDAVRKIPITEMSTEEVAVVTDTVEPPKAVDTPKVQEDTPAAAGEEVEKTDGTKPEETA